MLCHELFKREKHGTWILNTKVSATEKLGTRSKQDHIYLCTDKKLHVADLTPHGDGVIGREEPDPARSVPILRKNELF